MAKPLLDPGSYPGAVSIIFTPSAAAATLSFFWDVMRSLVGVAQVADHTALERGSGYQFTLDLGSEVLALDRLRDDIPEAEFVDLGADRFRVQLAQTEG